MQDIITHIIVFIAFGYTLYQFVMLFIPVKGDMKNSCRGGCSACNLKNDILLQYQMKNLTLGEENDEISIKQ